MSQLITTSRSGGLKSLCSLQVTGEMSKVPICSSAAPAFENLFEKLFFGVAIRRSAEPQTEGSSSLFPLSDPCRRQETRQHLSFSNGKQLKYRRQKIAKQFICPITFCNFQAEGFLYKTCSFVWSRK